MEAAPLTLKSIEITGVAPPPGTTPDRASLPFTYSDIFWLNFPPVERLFFYHYPHSTSHFLCSLLPSLKSSLSLALKTYYPLAGGFRRTPGTDNKLEHYYAEGDSVSFIVAECNGQFEDLASDRERDVLQLNCLAPQLPNSEERQAVLAVQVTIFPDQGIVLATSLDHTACDGTSSMQFMHNWAEICLLGAPMSGQLPVFDRTLVSDPSELYTLFYNQAQQRKAALQGNTRHIKPSDLILVTFRFGQEQIKKLKQLVLAKAEERKTSFHCSTIVVTFAYVWTSIVRTKRIDSTKRVSLGIPANFRSRVRPPLPREYFGNCIGPCIATAHVRDLIQEDGVIVAAEVIGKAVDKLSECSTIPSNWRDKFGSGMPLLTVAGSPKFKVYDVDFGIGRPTKVEILSATKTGAIAVADNRDEQGVEIGLAFPRDEMDCFKKHFFDGLKLLSE